MLRPFGSLRLDLTFSYKLPKGNWNKWGDRVIIVGPLGKWPGNSCTLHSPMLSNRFQWTFTRPSQFQRTHRTACQTSNRIHWTWPNSAACPVQVQWKSSEVTLKQKNIGLARLTSPLDFRWTSNGLKGRKWTKCAKCWVQQTSNGLSMDFQWNLDKMC